MSSNGNSWARNLLDDINERQINTIVTDAIVGESSGHPVNAMIDIARVYYDRLVQSGVTAQNSGPDQQPVANINHIKANSATFAWLECYAVTVAKEARNQSAEDRSIYKRIQSKSLFLKEVAMRVETRDGSEISWSGYRDGSEGPRLNLSGRDRSKIAQAWELGTSSVAIQTTIGLDGDLVTLISRDRLDQKNATLREIHDKSVQTSISTWESLLNGLLRLAQAAID